MDKEYVASVTDRSTYDLTVSIDGKSKNVVDYVGAWVGMPSVITDLEDAVDGAAGTSRWIAGADGLVSALRNEGLRLNSPEAQDIAKEAATRGQTSVLQQLVESGLSLEPIPLPKAENAMKPLGWLESAADHPDTLAVLIRSGVSKDDQVDKDTALARAASAGQLDAVRALIHYGADPNTDFGKLTITEEGAGMMMQYQGPGSVLINAARSGNPDVVREVLKYKPNVELRGLSGQTAVFAAGACRHDDEDDEDKPCVEILRLLVQAGADVNARDSLGNSPLHETYLRGIERELLKLGANVNARNNDGETPIFTTIDDKAIPLFIAHGADLSIRNKKGETVVEAAKEKGPYRRKALAEAIASAKSR